MRAASEPIPVRIEEVWAFGSFIRLKEKPGDLDLAVKYSERHALWDSFDKEMGEVIRAYRSQRGDYPTPSHALSFELRKKNELDDRWNVYSKWAKNATWGRADRDWLMGKGIYWDGVTREMLLEGLPRVHIAQMEPVTSSFWLLTEVRVLVWSREKPDVETNLASGLGGKELGRNLANEIAGFDRQLEPLQFEAGIQKALWELVTSKDISKDDLASLNSLAKQTLLNVDPDRIDRCLKNPQEFFTEEVKKPIDTDVLASYLSLSTRELQSLAERRRVMLKAAHDEVEILRHMVDAAVEWIQMPADRRQYFTQYKMTDFVAECALRWAGRGPGTERKIRVMLRAFGLPESGIVYWQDMRDYRLPKSKEEMESIASSNAMKEAGKELRARLGRVAREFNKELDLYPVLSKDLRPESINLHCFVGSEDKGKGWAAELAWFKSHGFDLEEKQWGTYARLFLDVTRCKGAEEIENLLREKLSSP